MARLGSAFGCLLLRRKRSPNDDIACMAYGEIGNQLIYGAQHTDTAVGYALLHSVNGRVEATEAVKFH